MSKSLTKGHFMATQNQINANRENAKLSTGPVSPEGRANSSHNAVKTGLTGQTVLLKTDDVAVYNQHLERFQKQFAPATDQEKDLVQDLADTEWRLLRIVPLESKILALGRIELAPLFADQEDPAVRESLIEAKIFLTYRRDLNNLSLQESRLRKHRDVVTAQLKQLQQDRKRIALSKMQRAAAYFEHALQENWHFRQSDFGFEFTIEELFLLIAQNRAIADHDVYPEVTTKSYLPTIREQYAEIVEE
jgi:hypothetical protein